MYRHILTPIDGGALSVSTIDQAVALARALDAKITFFHAKSDYESTSDAALERVISPETYEDHVAGDARAIVAKARAAARAQGVECDSVITVSKRPFEAILQAAEAEGCDLIFMASHGHRGLKGLVLGSQTQKLLNNSRIPVLVSTVARNTKSPDLDAALAVYKDEHRSIAAIVHGLEKLVQDYLQDGAAPDFDLLAGMIYYLKAFPQSYHHPKEDEVLFRKLRGRSPELDAVIDELHGEHLEELELTVLLEDALQRWAAGSDEGFLAFAALVDRYAEETWHHLTLEDTVIVANAKEYFTPADWKEVADSFGQNKSPALSMNADNPYYELFTQIMNLYHARVKQPKLAHSA